MRALCGLEPRLWIDTCNRWESLRSTEPSSRETKTQRRTPSTGTSSVMRCGTNWECPLFPGSWNSKNNGWSNTNPQPDGPDKSGPFSKLNLGFDMSSSYKQTIHKPRPVSGICLRDSHGREHEDQGRRYRSSAAGSQGN